MDWTTSPLYCYPTGTTGVALEPSGEAWDPGAWVQVIAETPQAWTLAGITVERVSSASFGSEIEIDLALGDESEEEVFATLHVSDLFNDLSVGARDPATNGGRLVLPVPVAAIPSGSRISARVRTNDARTAFVYVVLDYYKRPTVGTMVTTTQRPRVIPSTTPGPDVDAGGASMVFGDWVQLGSFDPAVLLTDYILSRSTYALAGGGGDLQIGVGSIGDEVPVCTHPFRHYDYFGIGNRGIFPIPIALEAESTISVRVRSIRGGGTARVKVGYLELPL